MPAPAGEGAAQLSAILPVWPDLLSAIAARRGVSGSQRAKAVLAQGQPVAVRNGELVLAFATPQLERIFKTSGVADQLLCDALTDRFGGTWKVSSVQKGSEPGSPTAGTTSRRVPEDVPAVEVDEPSPETDPDVEVDLRRDGERARVHDPVAVAIAELGAQIVDERETS